MKRVRQLCLPFIVLLLPVLANAQTVRVGAISQSINNWPMWVAEAKGHFRDEGLNVVLTVTGESEHQLSMMDSGQLDIIHQAADHFVREIEDGKTYVVIHTITRAANDLMTRPEYHSFEDLRGKTIALDNLQTGYWLLYRRVLAKNGLNTGDYILSPESGGPGGRMQKIRDNSAQVTYMNAPESIKAELEGYRILTNLSEHYPEFPASSIGTHRAWAAANRDTVIAYLRGYIRATEWLLDPANREEAIAIAAGVGHDPDALPGSLETFLKNGMVRHGTLSRTGFDQVGELLIEGNVISRYEGFEKYADPSFQQEALRQLQARQ